MKHRILIVILGLCVLFGVILTLPGCSSNKENDETYAYIFFPSGKMLALGEVEGAWHGSNGLLGITIDGIEYQTHCSNVVLVTKRTDILMKINHTKRLYCEVLSRALNKRGPEYREIIRNRLDRMLEMRHLSLETTDFDETNEISNIILKVWQDIDDAKPDYTWVKRGVDKARKQ